MRADTQRRLLASDPIETNRRLEAITRRLNGADSAFGISPWERGFLSDLVDVEHLSVKQDTTLRAIERKVLGSEADRTTGDLFA